MAISGLACLLALVLPAHAAAGGALDTQRQNAQGAGAPSGPVASASDALSSLDFVAAPDGADVVLGVPNGVTPTASQVGSRVTVWLPGVTVPGSLQRPLDASYFAAPVLRISAAPVTGGGQVTVELREGATWALVQGDDGYWRVSTRFGEHGVIYPTHDPSRTIGDSYAPSGGGYGGQVQESSQITGQNDVGIFRDAMGYGGAMPAVASQPITARMNIDLVESDIHNVLRLIGHTANLNIVAADSVKGTVTVNLHDVTWQDALAAILLSEGLSASVDGGTMVVAPLGSGADPSP